MKIEKMAAEACTRYLWPDNLADCLAYLRDYARRLEDGRPGHNYFKDRKVVPYISYVRDGHGGLVFTRADGKPPEPKKKAAPAAVEKPTNALEALTGRKTPKRSPYERKVGAFRISNNEDKLIQKALTAINAATGTLYTKSDLFRGAVLALARECQHKQPDWSGIEGDIKQALA